MNNFLQFWKLYRMSEQAETTTKSVHSEMSVKECSSTRNYTRVHTYTALARRDLPYWESCFNTETENHIIT